MQTYTAIYKNSSGCVGKPPLSALWHFAAGWFHEPDSDFVPKAYDSDPNLDQKMSKHWDECYPEKIGAWVENGKKDEKTINLLEPLSAIRLAHFIDHFDGYGNDLALAFKQATKQEIEDVLATHPDSDKIRIGTDEGTTGIDIERNVLEGAKRYLESLTPPALP